MYNLVLERPGRGVFGGPKTPQELHAFEKAHYHGGVLRQKPVRRMSPQSSRPHLHRFEEPGVDHPLEQKEPPFRWRSSSRSPSPSPLYTTSTCDLSKKGERSSPATREMFLKVDVSDKGRVSSPQTPFSSTLSSLASSSRASKHEAQGSKRSLQTGPVFFTASDPSARTSALLTPRASKLNFMPAPITEETLSSRLEDFSLRKMTPHFDQSQARESCPWRTSKKCYGQVEGTSNFNNRTTINRWREESFKALSAQKNDKFIQSLRNHKLPPPKFEGFSSRNGDLSPSSSQEQKAMSPRFGGVRKIKGGAGKIRVLTDSF